MNPFEKIATEYDYADIMQPGGFMIDGKPALTQVDPSLVGDYVIIVVRDPLLVYEEDPAILLGKKLTDGVIAGKSGMFTTYSGYYKGAHISIVSGGSGAPEAELVLIELMHHTKANTFIRLGGGAAIGRDLKSGDVVIASGVVRDDGMTKEYIHAGYPAVCSFELVTAFAKAAEDMGARYHVGVGRSGDSEHIGGGRMTIGGYIQPRNTEIIDYYHRAGVLYWDRESSAIVTLANLFGRRGGAVVSVDNNLVTREPFTPGDGQQAAIEIAFEGYANLHKMDEAKKSRAKRFWVPDSI